MLKLRGWQLEASEKRSQASGHVFNVEGTPGCGKTMFASHEASVDLASGRSKRIVVVCPTTHIKRQWALTMRRMGIALDERYDMRRAFEAKDYKGVVVTYAQLARNPNRFRTQAESRPTTVIIDEIHHCGETLTWGAALSDAFEVLGDRVTVLTLTGTPIRSDNNRIPFLHYRRNVVHPDYVYTPSRAVEEGVVRPVVFIPYNGEIEWEQRGVAVAVTLGGDASRKLRNRALSIAIQEREYLIRLIRDADDMLTEVRKSDKSGNPKSAGMIVAKDTEHAQELASIFKELYGYEPPIVVSDSDAATGTIKAFENSNERWLISVRMVSEGVDIPRLRVGVFATNVKTEVYFRQWVGRFVRTQYGTDKSYLFIPRYKELELMASRIEDEIRHKLVDKVESEEDGSDRGEVERNVEYVNVLGAKNDGATVAIMHGNQLTLFGLLGMADVHGALSKPHQVKDVEVVVDTLVEQKEALRQAIHSLVASVAYRKNLQPRDIYHELNRWQGVKQADCTMPQLEARLKRLKGMR